MNENDRDKFIVELKALLNKYGYTMTENIYGYSDLYAFCNPENDIEMRELYNELEKAQ